MPPKKRPYVPKTKGCYQCSRRRIHCDRTEPHCKKCTSRGLECKGLGIRLRFTFGCSPEQTEENELSAVNTSVPLVQPKGTSEEDIQNDVHPATSETAAENTTGWQTAQYPGFDIFDQSLVTIDDILIPDLNSLESPIETEPPKDDYPTNISMAPANTSTLYQPMPDELPRWKSELCLHFSRCIATEMVAIDGSHNGWRFLILPFARSDDLVLNAVLTVSAYHIWLNRAPAANLSNKASLPIPDPNQLYRHVISGLRQHSGFENCDSSRKNSILLTILVLLVGVMVTGRSDFPMLFRMLESALVAIGGSQVLGDGEVAQFIMPQVAKLRLYAAPLLSEESGLEVVSSQDHAAQLFSCLNQRLSESPEHSASSAFITDLVQQAINMYLEQVIRSSASSDPPSALDIADSITRVEHFKETLEAFPPGAPGEQVIVWACFVAAASCLLDEHMEFFEDVFMRHYLRSGFANLLSGLELLRRIWARRPEERWTLMLAGARILVM